MKRRTFLQSLIASGGVLGSSGLPLFAQARRKLTFVAITDIGPDTSVARLRAMLGSMLAKGLPVSCIVRTTAENGESLRADSELAALLRDFMAKAPGILEIVGYVPDLASKDAFFQARLAYQARKDLIEVLVPDAVSALPGPLIQSLACDHVADPLSPEGVRSAGIRNVLVLPQTSATVSSEMWDNGVLRIFGGQSADLFAALDHLGELAPAQYQNVILLSVKENAAKSEHVVAAAATVFANVALRHEADQWITNLRLCDLQLRDGFFRFERRLGLHLFEPPADAPHLAQAFEAFKTDLTSARIAFSTGPEILEFADGTPRQGYWVPTESMAPKAKTLPARPEIAVQFDCAQTPRQIAPNARDFLEAGIGVALDPRAGGVQGIDECGRLHVPAIVASLSGPSRGRFLDGTDNTNDLAVTISPQLLATQAQRNTLQSELKKLKSDSVTSIVPLAELARPIAPTSHLISIYRQTEAYVPQISPQPTRLSEEQRQAFLEDALTAWSYFYRLTDKRTGMCPATVLYSGGTKTALKSATMWDVGSHINAMMAAVDLELIDKTEFQKGIAKILANIKGRTSNGRRLPSEWIRTDQAGRGNTNFDGCDAGRLLASLWNLSKHKYAVPGIAKLVASWDLDQIVVDKRIFSVINSELLSTYNSHCAHYSALAFRAWGMDVTSPYEVLANRPAAEGRMALLDVASGIGPFGAEPLLLEAMDFGLSSESHYLAEVLFGAQQREYETTGRLICASEGPLDKSPWFTYQGLQLDAPDRTWVIDTVRDDPEFTQPEFQQDFQVVSSKAAFLWAAQFPNQFSDVLLNYVRGNAKTTIGYASSIYSKTETATANYSDINTNGVILQAIARILADPGSS